MKSSVISHLEIEELQEQATQFLQFTDALFANASTVTSLGLLRHPLTIWEWRPSPSRSDYVRHATRCWVRFDWIDLSLGARSIEDRTRIWLRLDLSMSEDLLSKYGFTVLYVTTQFYFNEAFQIHKSDATLREPETMLPVWFIHIFVSGISYIEQYGIEEFNDCLRCNSVLQRHY